MTVVQLNSYRPAPRQRPRSQYDLYPLPFFNAAAHSTWDVEPTGDYGADCQTGHRYALEFLKSCDGTVGWASLLPAIVADMVRAGTSGTFADGHPKVNGVVIGFMSVIGKVATIAWAMPDLVTLLEDWT